MKPVAPVTKYAMEVLLALLWNPRPRIGCSRGIRAPGVKRAGGACHSNDYTDRLPLAERPAWRVTRTALPAHDVPRGGRRLV